MDKRLDAGRHHPNNGEGALADPYLDERCLHFETALLRFRGPQLPLGDAHALRGLPHLEQAEGKLNLADSAVRAAVQGDQSVCTLLERIDLDGVSPQLWSDAEEGEALTRALEVQERAGNLALEVV